MKVFAASAGFSKTLFSLTLFVLVIGGILFFSSACLELNGAGKTRNAESGLLSENALTWANGTEYEGDHKDGRPDGQGRINYPNGHHYEGTWKEGFFNEQGIYNVLDENGKVISTEQTTYQEDGLLLSKEKTVYDEDGKPLYTEVTTRNEDGTYGNAKVPGSGDPLKTKEPVSVKAAGLPPADKTLTWPDGTYYVGGMKDGKPDGQGTMVWPDGTTYIGGFKDGKNHGQGSYHIPDDGHGYGDGYLQGRWEDGVYIKWWEGNQSAETASAVGDAAETGVAVIAGSDDQAGAKVIEITIEHDDGTPPEVISFNSDKQGNYVPVNTAGGQTAGEGPPESRIMVTTEQDIPLDESGNRILEDAPGEEAPGDNSGIIEDAPGDVSGQTGSGSDDPFGFGNKGPVPTHQDKTSWYEDHETGKLYQRYRDTETDIWYYRYDDRDEWGPKQ